jgi:flagellar assembly protein FliH
LSRRKQIIKTARLRAQSVVVRAAASARGGQPASEAQEPPAPTFEDLEAQARAKAMAIVTEARRQAEEVLNQAREHTAELRLQAYQEGYNEGRDEGLAQARREMEQALALVQATAREAKQLRDRIIAGSERQVIELVLDVVRKVIATELDSNPRLVVETVERAMKRLGSQRVVRIRVNPAELETVRVAFAEAAERDWDITEDGVVSLGGCIIDTEAGTIDARLDTQIAEVEETFREMTDDR